MSILYFLNVSPLNTYTSNVHTQLKWTQILKITALTPVNSNSIQISLHSPVLSSFKARGHHTNTLLLSQNTHTHTLTVTVFFSTIICLLQATVWSITLCASCYADKSIRAKINDNLHFPFCKVAIENQL